MSMVWLSVYLAAILLMGHVIVSMILRGERRSRVECAGLVLAIGAGGLGQVLLWASLVGFTPGRSILAVIVLVFGAKQWQLVWKHQWPWSRAARSEGHSRLDGLCTIAAIAVITGCVVMVSVQAIALPVYSWDAFAIWAFKAKVLLRESLSSRPPYFYDTTLSYSHLDYPLLIPFLMAGAFGAMGEGNEHLGNIVFPVLFLALGFQMFGALRWKIDRPRSLLLTALMMSIPTVMNWAGAGIADVALILYYTGSVFYFLKWMEEQRRADLILTILFSVFTASTKNEGFALALILGGFMFLFAASARNKAKLADFLFFTVGFMVLQSPWIWWSRAIPRTHENYGGRLRLSVVIENWDRMSVIVGEFLKQAWTWPRWGGVWVLLFLVAILGYRGFGRRFVVVVWLLLISQLGLYALIFVVTPWDVRELLGSALDRVLMQTLPSVVLLVGFHWKEINALS